MRRRGGMSPFKAGLIAIVVLAIGIYLGFTKSIPFRQHFEIKAAFTSSNNLKPNSPVRIAGVEIGKVSKVESTSPGANSAVVTMRINDNGRPIHRDATAKIRPRIFLEGNFFVDMTAGSPAEPELEDGDTIPITQTATPVQLDQVLKALKAPTREELQATLGQLASAYEAGFAEAFNDTLEDQAPAFRYSAIVLEALLGREPRDLSNVVRDLGTTAQALDRSPARLKSFLTNFNRTAAALAIESDNLEATVQELPRTLQAAGPALDELNASFPAVRRFAVSALPGVRSSGPAVAALRPFIGQLAGLTGEAELRGLTRDLRRATPRLVGLSTRSVPLLRELRQLASCTNEVLIPWAEDTVPDRNFPATGPVYQELVKFLPGLGGESRSFDGNGPWMKVLGSGGAGTLELGNGVFGFPIFQVDGVNPPPPQSRPPLRGDVPCETQQPPNLDTVPQGPPTTVSRRTPSAATQEREDKAQRTMLMILADQMRDEGMDVTIGEGEFTRADIDALARRTGRTAQLEVLRSGIPLTRENIRKAGG